MNSNTPDDWSLYYRRCEICDNQWHLSESVCCTQCENRHLEIYEKTMLLDSYGDENDYGDDEEE